MKRLRYENGDLDATDVRILNALVDDARTSIADLARSVGLSPPSVSERIKRLEEAGVIEGYTLTINPKALGLPIAAWLRIRPIPGQLQKVADILRGLRQIVECRIANGELAGKTADEVMQVLLSRISGDTIVCTSSDDYCVSVFELRLDIHVVPYETYELIV